LTTFTAQQSRVDALVRMLGLVILAFGAAMVYFTYQNAAFVTAPEIVTINYALGLILLAVGIIATFAKLK
jgi:energy-converting hydrogenase Eha subunit E